MDSDLQGPDGLSVRLQDYFSRKRNLKELHSEDDDSGYIEGKVIMTWPPRNRLHRVGLEVMEDFTLHRFELEVPYRDGITFHPHDRVCIALKGIKVDRRDESSAPHHFPVALRFPDGIVLKYLSGVNTGKTINTWVGNTDEWYNPGVVHTVSNAVTTDASEICRGLVPTITYPPRLTPRGDIISLHGEGVKADRPLSVADAAQSMQPTQGPNNGKPSRSSKKKSRKRRRLQKDESTHSNQQPHEVARSPPIDASVSCHGQSEILTRSSLTNVSACRPKTHHANGQANGEASIRENNGIDLSRENSCSNTSALPSEAGVSALRLKAGVCTQRGDVFTALIDLQTGRSMINIIAIVKSVTPEKKTRTNAWMRSFTLVDPSIVDSSQQCITINCFQDKYPEWLPQVRKDDIVILRKLRIIEFGGGVTATGYSDKLRWAVYDPLIRSTRPPTKGNAPDKELMDGGMGYEFSPYWEPQDSRELEYCQQIGEWWKAKQELEGQNACIVESPRLPPKQHRLISEASPELPPKGFFNCTVEVLQKFDNQYGATTVYVTDYTASTLVHPVQATWCPPELSNCILQCIMWDSARSIARMMNPGEYWYLHNVRARWNPGHYMEGTMQHAKKITQLDETKLEAQPHLEALLARKKDSEWKKSSLASGSTSLHVFPEMHIQDIEGGTNFLTCVVELLHLDLDSRDGDFIYVTDYTFNPDLPITVATADWAYNLGGRVVKIKLDNTQAKNSSDLRSGSMYTIRNLRIKRLDTSGNMYGCLGGEDTLIIPLHDLSSQQARVLHRNKEEWKRENILGVLTMNGPQEETRETHKSLGQTSTISDTITLQDVLARPVPSVFKVLARVMDFFPFSLEDACAIRCTKCNSSPPSSFERCPRCDDMIQTHCKWFYRLYFLLQDEKGSELIVSLPEKECTLLQDIDPTDFHRDQVAFRQLLEKLDPVLGNLRDVHMAWSGNEHKVVQTSLMVFTLESWKVDDEKGYSLLDCIPACGDTVLNSH